MATLAFKGLNYGAQNIPDKAFESIPVVGPRYFKEREEEEKRENDKRHKEDKMRDRDRDRDRRHAHRDRSPLDERRSSTSSASDGGRDANYTHSRPSRPGRSYRRSSVRDRRDGYHDRGYESDDGLPKGYGGQAPYFPPPPTRAVDDPADGAVPHGYNPADYPPPPGSQTGSNPYVPPPPIDSPYLAAGNQPAPHNYEDDPSRHSSVADRYRPADWDARSGSTYQDRGPSPNAYRAAYSPSPDPRYPSALAVRPGSPGYSAYADPRAYPPQQLGYPTYEPPREESETSSGRRRRHDRDRDHSRDRDRGRDSGSDDSRSRRRSKSRGDKGRSRSRATSRVRETFDKHKKDMGASALGALAGAFIGNELTKSKSKRGKHAQPLGGKLGMIAGAAIGGIGANFIERRREEEKRRKLRVGEDDGYDSY